MMLVEIRTSLYPSRKQLATKKYISTQALDQGLQYNSICPKAKSNSAKRTLWHISKLKQSAGGALRCS